MSAHETSVKHQAAWDEYRPECSCGWVGSYLPFRRMATREAKRHEGESSHD